MRALDAGGRFSPSAMPFRRALWRLQSTSRPVFKIFLHSPGVPRAAGSSDRDRRSQTIASFTAGEACSPAQPIVHPAPFFAALDEAGLAQDGHVLGDRRRRQFQELDQLADAQLHDPSSTSRARTRFSSASARVIAKTDSMGASPFRYMAKYSSVKQRCQLISPAREGRFGWAGRAITIVVSS